ncbi:MAG: DEAD/DEAH box helicase family protein [Armatimonadetes bacterium]|nr:DEAD/DEAH box helicase family protein [Armatimonadota bacterium]
MAQVVIENPVINSPFEEPRRHFRFDEDGITSDIVESRRRSSYFIPVPKAKKKSKQLVLATEWTQERIEENTFINLVRERVGLWRREGRPGVTPVTRQLLAHWTAEDRERRLYFCQIEALETLIYLTECAGKMGDASLATKLKDFNNASNPGLDRLALKMATGTGKTVVMAMLIAWHTLNKLANRQDTRFSDTFLIITPGITIKDRLRVLLPNDGDNYYRTMDVVPADMREDLGQANILITNYHAFLHREKISAGKLTKEVLQSRGGSSSSTFTETPDEMVRRVCRQFGSKKNIIVINDEAHHCYRRKPEAPEEKLTGDERKEAQKRDEAARVWISGIEAVKNKIGVKAIYDLSATPFFLRGSGYPEGMLFPWVVSDFSLVDAIESGIVKVPRVPVADDSMTGDQPTYRDLWTRIRDDLPKKGRGTEAAPVEPKLPAELEGAIRSLYGNYEKYYRQWEQSTDDAGNSGVPPVFIVVCNNTNVSKLVFDFIAGWEKPLEDGQTVNVPGALPLFSNVEHGQWLHRPNTILIDSEQLESGEAMSDEFKKIAAAEIEEFKAEYVARFPGRDASKLTDEDLLREVMNTVGKRGKLGEHVRCVVSVSMLTEGWDANTVTHILGVRAFGTQLLCEQVVGRGLRRMSHQPDDNGLFPAEYAEVYGVPFSFIPAAGSMTDPKPGPIPTRVRALEDRIACEITFPRVSGYRYEFPAERLTADFTEDSRFALTTEDVTTRTKMGAFVGETVIHNLDDLRKHRMQEVAFILAKRTLEAYFRDEEGNIKHWYFPDLVEIARRWLEECLTCKDNCFPQLMLLTQFQHDAADRIYRAIVASQEGEKRLIPILRPYDTVGSTRYVDFDTTRPVYATDPEKCHISHVVADTESWEQKLAQALEEMVEVAHYVKNHNLGFTIPYSLSGEERSYIPDFICHVRQGDGQTLNLILECSGEKRKDKTAKTATARTLWVPAINNHGGYGRWAFLEISDPWDAKQTIRAWLHHASHETHKTHADV